MCLAAAGSRIICCSGSLSLTERLIELIPELDIHIIPDNGLNGRFAAKHREIMCLPTLSIFDLFKSTLLLVSATLIGFFVLSFGVY